MNKIPELCRNCPNRTAKSRLLGLLSLRPESTEQCGGYVSVARGEVTYLQRAEGEPAPPRRQWSYMVGASDDRRYYSIAWNPERVCGQEEVIAFEGEVPYGESEGFTDKQGRPAFAFIRGDKRALDDVADMENIIQLLDSVDDMGDVKTS